MDRLIPPLCLFLALAMLVAGFAVWAIGAPEPNVDLHRAIVSGDEEYRDVLEAQLLRRQLQRKLLMGCLFAGSGVMTVTAFLSMRPAEARRSRV